MNNFPDISIVVPTYNRSKLLTKTINYLSSLNYPAYEIVIVDQSENNSNEFNTAEIFNNEKIRYFKIAERGLPLARNFGILQSKGNIILFCDDDIIPSQNLIKAHVKNYDDPSIGGIAGRIAAKNKISNPQKIGIINRITGNQIDNFYAENKTEVDHGQGCNISFRTSILKQVGGFDTRFGGSAFLEETDVCLRIKQAGYKLLFEPKATVIHLKDASGGCRPASLTDWYYWYGHNYMLLFWKNFNKTVFPTFLFYRFINFLKGYFKFQNKKIISNGFKGMRDATKLFRETGIKDDFFAHYK